jgi:hypothetical protein
MAILSVGAYGVPPPPSMLITSSMFSYNPPKQICLLRLENLRSDGHGK